MSIKRLVATAIVVLALMSCGVGSIFIKFPGTVGHYLVVRN